MTETNFSRRVAAFVTMLAMLLAFSAAPAGAKPAAHWVSSWATAVMDMGCCSLGPKGYDKATLRETVHVSLGGKTIRLKLSNAFGDMPMHIAGVHVARAAATGSDKIDPATDTVVTFDGKADVILPARGEYLSDPVTFDLPAHGDLAVTILYDQMPAGESGHPYSRSTSYMLRGDHLSDADMKGAWQVEHWYQLASVDVVAPKKAYAVAALGDSITDGFNSTLNANHRWPDELAALKNVGVLDLGISAGRVLDEGYGPSALARFDRDVLGKSHVKVLVLLEGINDIGNFDNSLHATDAEFSAFSDRLIGGYQQIIARAHAAGIKVIGATVTPFADDKYYPPQAAGIAARQKVNAWIRTKGHFDAVVDFDKVVRDPKDPEHFNPAYDSGDHLHPSDAGYKAMGEAVAKVLKSVRE